MRYTYEQTMHWEVIIPDLVWIYLQTIQTSMWACEVHLWSGMRYIYDQKVTCVARNFRFGMLVAFNIAFWLSTFSKGLEKLDGSAMDALPFGFGNLIKLPVSKDRLMGVISHICLSKGWDIVLVLCVETFFNCLVAFIKAKNCQKCFELSYGINSWKIPSLLNKKLKWN